MIDLEKTYLRISLIVDMVPIHGYLEKIFGDAYRTARDQHLVQGNVTAEDTTLSVTQKQIALAKAQRENKVRTYNDWLYDVSVSLCKYLNSVFNVCGQIGDVGSIVRYMEDEFFIERTAVAEELRHVLVLTEEQEEAIDQFFDYMDNLVAEQREAFDRLSSHELIHFSPTRPTGHISIEFWGDNRIHLYNQMMASNDLVLKSLDKHSSVTDGTPRT